MKLLASDYDGTLKIDVKSLLINIEYIRKFQEKGHKFMITTGRNFTSIKNQINYFNIPYDYLSCNDGAVLFDRNDNVLFADYLKIKNIEVFLARIYGLDITSQVKIYGIYDQIQSLDNMLEMNIITKLFSEKSSLFNILKDYELNIIKVLNSYYLENIGGKSRSINYLNETESFDEIITIGDSKNDVEMLRDYHGYRMLSSTPSLYLSNLKTTTSVKKLIKKII